MLATQTLALLSVPWDESTTGILSVLVFGAGTDYALLLISRYRDELRTHEDRREAMRVALRRTSHAVLASATTVVLGVLSLVLSVFPTTRGLGIACAVGIVVAAAFALVALPATLVLFGRWVFWPKVPRIGSESLAEGRSLWRRVGDAVSRRPAPSSSGRSSSSACSLPVSPTSSSGCPPPTSSCRSRKRSQRARTWRSTSRRAALTPRRCSPAPRTRRRAPSRTSTGSTR